MADTREKLIKLLNNFGCPLVLSEWEVSALADHLIANGVTVQRWIPVTERLPEIREGWAESIDADGPDQGAAGGVCADGRAQPGGC